MPYTPQYMSRETQERIAKKFEAMIRNTRHPGFLDGSIPDHNMSGIPPIRKIDVADGHTFGVFTYELGKGSDSAELASTWAERDDAEVEALARNSKPFNVRFFSFVRPIEVRHGRYVRMPG